MAMVLQRRRWFTEGRQERSSGGECMRSLQGGLSNRDYAAEARLRAWLAHTLRRITSPTDHHHSSPTRHRGAACARTTDDIILSQLRSLREGLPGEPAEVIRSFPSSRGAITLDWVGSLLLLAVGHCKRWE
jgi:hypothetical protein